MAREENQQAESSISAPPAHARSRFEKETYTLPKFGLFKIIIWASQSLPFVPGFILKTALTFEWQLLSSGGITVKILLEAARQHCDQGLGKRQLSTRISRDFGSVWQSLLPRGFIPNLNKSSSFARDRVIWFLMLFYLWPSLGKKCELCYCAELFSLMVSCQV